MTESELVDDAFTVRPLAPETWDAFADLAERHSGVWGGCWCTWFHTMHDEKTFDADDNRALKKRLVNEGRAHAALVFDGDEAVAWCQFGSPQELPNTKHRKKVTASFLYSVTRRLFEQAGFSYVRPKGKNHTVMRKAVKAAR